MTTSFPITRTRRLVAAVGALVAVTAGLAVGMHAPAEAVAPVAAPVVVKAASARAATTQVQHVRVNWKGNWKNPDYVNTATIPGIGSLDLVCKPNDTKIKLYTDNRSRETQMWLQKYEIKNGKKVVAVKTPRIYQYAHADDNGKGGTGFYTHEGLNQVPSIENRSEDGYMYGVISQQSSRAKAGGQVASPLPVTTFELDWNWNGFDHPQQYRSCTIDATFTTQYPADQRSVLTWRGWQTDPQQSLQTAIPGVGWLHLSCPTPSDPDVPPTVWIDPYTTDDVDSSQLYIEDVRGEGEVAYQVTKTTLRYDSEKQIIGPYELPSNGTLRMQATNGTAQRWLMLSSYFVTNDRWGPRRNVCEIAAGWYNR